MSTAVEVVDVLVVGGGPTGLSAARECRRSGASVVLLESGPALGGLARAAKVNKTEVDLGGHRLLCNTDDQFTFWHDFAEMIGDVELHNVEKRSGILRDGVVLSYPVDWGQFRTAAPWGTRARGALSLIKRKARPLGDDNLSDWVRNRYGDYLTDAFMAPHARKIFGVDPAHVPATWAPQRIAVPQVRDVLSAAVPNIGVGRRPPREVAARDQFLYPQGGIGVLWEGLARTLRSRVQIRLNARVQDYRVDPDGLITATYSTPLGPQEVRCRRVISTAPTDDLARTLGLHRLADEIVDRAKHRDLIVGLVCLPSIPRAWQGFQWLYTHGEGMRASRFQNYAEWTGLNPTDGLIGLEYPVPANSSIADARWWVKNDLALIGVEQYTLVSVDVLHNAYSNFDAAQPQIAELDGEVKRLSAGLLSTGRQGAGIYINMDQAMTLGKIAGASPGRLSGVAGVDTYSRYQERSKAALPTAVSPAAPR